MQAHQTIVIILMILLSRLVKLRFLFKWKNKKIQWALSDPVVARYTKLSGAEYGIFIPHETLLK